MSPILRSPVPVSGAVEGLLCRGMPVLTCDDIPAVVISVDDGAANVALDAYPYDSIESSVECFRVDWSSPVAVGIAIRWLMDRGHRCDWMRPLRYGGRVPAWDGLTEDEVAAILVSVSVREVAEGGKPVADLFVASWRDNGRNFERKSLHRESTLLVAYEGQRLWSGFGWDFFGEYKPSGSETGDAGKAKADEAALADRCALLVPGGVMVSRG